MDLRLDHPKNGSRKTRRVIRDVVDPVLGKTEDYSPTQMFYKEIGFKQATGGTRMADKVFPASLRIMLKLVDSIFSDSAVDLSSPL